MPLALRAARALKANGTAPRDAVLLSLIDAFARRDVAEVRDLADHSSRKSSSHSWPLCAELGFGSRRFL